MVQMIHNPLMLFVTCLMLSIVQASNDEDHNKSNVEDLNKYMIHNPKYAGGCAPYTAFGGKIPDTSFVNGKPFFSWDHIPVFWHGGSRTEMSDDVIGYITNHPFATVTLEKFQGVNVFPRAGNAETKLFETAAKIKAMNPTSQIIFFQNVVISFPNYELDCYLRENNMLLKDDENNYLNFDFHSRYPDGSCNGMDSYKYSKDLHIFDYSNPKFLPYWKERLENITNSDLFSGIFADRMLYGLPMQKKKGKWKGKMSDTRINNWFDDFDKGVDIIGEIVYSKNKIVIGNNRNYNLNQDQHYGRMFEIFMVGKNSMNLSPYDQLSILIEEAPKRQIHAHGDSCSEKHQYKSLAGFLIGACKYSYYACTNRFELSKKNKSFVCWNDDYNKSLGAPLGKAKISNKGEGISYFREFSSGTKVFVWIESSTSTNFNTCICYSDGTSSCSGGNCLQMERDFKNIYTKSLDDWEDDGCA